MARLFFKVKASNPERCCECHLPLGIPGMGKTLTSVRGKVHTLCVPTIVRVEGLAALHDWLNRPAHA